MLTASQFLPPEGDSLARYGANMVPVDWKPARNASPVFNYPYARSRETLDTFQREIKPALDEASSSHYGQW